MAFKTSWAANPSRTGVVENRDPTEINARFLMMIEASVQAKNPPTIWTVHDQSVRLNKFIDISGSLV